jgi:hypothetical protein
MRQGSNPPALRNGSAIGASLEAARGRQSSNRTRFAELMILCARIGFNP